MAQGNTYDPNEDANIILQQLREKRMRGDDLSTVLAPLYESVKRRVDAGVMSTAMLETYIRNLRSTLFDIPATDTATIRLGERFLEALEGELQHLKHSIPTPTSNKTSTVRDHPFIAECKQDEEHKPGRQYIREHTQGDKIKWLYSLRTLREFVDIMAPAVTYQQTANWFVKIDKDGNSVKVTSDGVRQAKETTRATTKAWQLATGAKKNCNRRRTS